MSVEKGILMCVNAKLCAHLPSTDTGVTTNNFNSQLLATLTSITATKAVFLAWSVSTPTRVPRGLRSIREYGSPGVFMFHQGLARVFITYFLIWYLPYKAPGQPLPCSCATCGLVHLVLLWSCTPALALQTRLAFTDGLSRRTSHA
eukprot:1177205-Prorocentrum_minimum.AAC.2